MSADYCQLELRILAHFSEDEALLKAFNSSSDIFTSIASKWNNIPESMVSNAECFTLVFLYSFKWIIL